VEARNELVLNEINQFPYQTCNDFVREWSSSAKGQIWSKYQVQVPLELRICIVDIRDDYIVAPEPLRSNETRGQI
jgi:hypothetical protein